MNIKQLNKEQLTELKQSYYTQKNDNVSYYELSIINDIVSDEKIFKEYNHIEFTEDDFSCSMT
jgi:hypothetical protein